MSHKYKRKKKKRESFCAEVGGCTESFKTAQKVKVAGDMSAKAGSECIVKVTGRSGVSGMDGNG